MWKIIKGSEADFKGAPEWAEECIFSLGWSRKSAGSWSRCSRF